MKRLMAACLCLPLAALAQDDNPQPSAVPPPPQPCTAPEYRQFDFWIGEWEVTENGQPAGRNRIEAIHGGCALAEHWVSARSGFTGSSLNSYDAANGRWHQAWVDSSGGLLELHGGLVDGSMVLTGQRPGTDGQVRHERISWTPGPDGSVRQHWQASTDGTHWTTVFDGHYRRAGGGG